MSPKQVRVVLRVVGEIEEEITVGKCADPFMGCMEEVWPLADGKCPQEPFRIAVIATLRGLLEHLDRDPVIRAFLLQNLVERFRTLEDVTRP